MGIGIDEVQLLNFADDQKAATAFLSGTGDFYIGSLPQERRLLSMEDRFVNAGGSEVLGRPVYGTTYAVDSGIYGEPQGGGTSHFGTVVPAGRNLR